MALGPAIGHVVTIVDYSTFHRRAHKANQNPLRQKIGRPRIRLIIRELAVQIAKDTGWGYRRILGELKKLRVGRISRQTVKNILVEHCLDPGPKRGRGTWSDLQCNFFSKRIGTLQGPRQVFALACSVGFAKRIQCLFSGDPWGLPLLDQGTERDCLLRQHRNRQACL